MVERGGLENRCAGNSTEGSNPSLSASNKHNVLFYLAFVTRNSSSPHASPLGALLLPQLACLIDRR